MLVVVGKKPATCAIIFGGEFTGKQPFEPTQCFDFKFLCTSVNHFSCLQHWKRTVRIEVPWSLQFRKLEIEYHTEKDEWLHENEPQQDSCLLIHGNPSKEDNTGRQHRNTTPEHNTERKTTQKHNTERQHRKTTQKHNHVLATHQDFKHSVGRDDQRTWWQVTVLLG